MIIDESLVNIREGKYTINEERREHVRFSLKSIDMDSYIKLV